MLTPGRGRAARNVDYLRPVGGVAITDINNLSSSGIPDGLRRLHEPGPDSAGPGHGQVWAGPGLGLPGPDGQYRFSIVISGPDPRDGYTKNMIPGCHIGGDVNLL